MFPTAFTGLYADTNFQSQLYCRYFGINLAFTYTNVRFGFTANNVNPDGSTPCGGNDTAAGFGITYDATSAAPGLYDTDGTGFVCHVGSECYQGDSTTKTAVGIDTAVQGLLWAKSN